MRNLLHPPYSPGRYDLSMRNPKDAQVSTQDKERGQQLSASLEIDCPQSTENHVSWSRSTVMRFGQTEMSLAITAGVVIVIFLGSSASLCAHPPQFIPYVQGYLLPTLSS